MRLAVTVIQRRHSNIVQNPKRRQTAIFGSLRNGNKAAKQVRILLVVAHFNNMRTLKFKGQPTNAFFATVNQMFGGSSQLPTMLTELAGSTMSFDYCALDSRRKLEGAAEHLIDGSEKRICRLTFEFKSPHVIERRSKNRKINPAAPCTCGTHFQSISLPYSTKQQRKIFK